MVFRMHISAKRTISHVTLLLSMIVGVLGWSAAPARSGVQDGYQVPTVVIPYAWKKPTMDGIVRDDEWQNAASVTALQTTSKAISARQTRFWLMWDEDNLYVAMRSPLRPGERLIQALRDPDHDVNVVFDDAYEVWLDLGTHSPGGEPVFFQYLSNFTGTRYDVMFEPAVGNSRIGWTSHWLPQNHLSKDGRSWEMEMAIPRQSMYKMTPFADGFAFTGLLTRDYKRPWEQVSFGGSGSFSVRETYPHFILSKSAPAVHLLSVGDPVAQTFGVHLAATGTTQTQSLKWEYASDGGVEKHGQFEVHPGQTTTLPPMLGLDQPGPGGYRIKVLSADGTMIYLDWSAPRQWGDRSALSQKLNDTGNQVVLTLQYNPVHNYLRVKGDLIDYDARSAIARYVLSVRDATGKVLAQKNLHLDRLAYVRDVVHFPALSPGRYAANLTTYDRSGKVVFTRDSKFEKKDAAKAFAWWNTKRGNIEKVISPWTPVRTTAGRFDVWGRTMRIGAVGLPAQITTQGRPLLARESTLVARFADGKTLMAAGASPRIISAVPNRGIARSQGQLGPLQVSSQVTTEFDGMYRVDLTITPNKPTVVRSLKLVVPLRSDVATYLHACGEGIRYGFEYRFLPAAKRGQLWNSQSVDGQPMTVGSFIPYIWLGDTTGGLCWFADSDQGWVPNDTTPAIEVRRDGANSTDLVLNFISKPYTLSRPRKISFAFQATPVKPIQPGWRMDTWWTNDSFQDWAQVESEGHAGNMGLIFSSLPFPLNPAKSRQMVEERHKQTNAEIFGFAKYRANAVPYFEHINMGEQFVPELTYFGDEWRTQVTRGLSYGKSLQDFMVYHVSHWVNDSDIDGFYIDNVSPIADDNIEAGRGYRLPDGRIQPAYQIFDTRRYFLRLRAALAEQGKSGKLVLHITNHMIAPWIGACDIALDGEDHVIYPEMHNDFMDFWSPERLRLDYPGEWGAAVNFLQEYQGKWDPVTLKKAMRAYTGMLILNDTLASANANGLNPELWTARDKFGIQSRDVRFLGYWMPQTGLESRTEHVSLAGWLKPGGSGSNKLLLAVVNTGEACDATVKVDFHKLGLPDLGQCSITDAETGQSVSVAADGVLKVAVPRHDYRQIVIQPRSR